MDKKHLPKAILITPTYNEKPNIQRLIPIIDRVFKKISGWDMSVLVVDDSSPDGTADAVRALQKEYSYVQLLVNKKKAGLGKAYLVGMHHAFVDLGADVVFEIDADLSHDPKKIPEFLAKLNQGADMVLGTRYSPGGSIPSNWGLHRKFLSVAGNWFISFVFASRAVSDWTGGYRAIKKSVYEAVHADLEKSEEFSGYTFQIGFLHKARQHGFKIAEVPFHFIDRTEGESKLGTEYLVNIMKFILRTRAIEIMQSRIFKFLVVGGIGFMVNFIFFNIFKVLHLWTNLAMTLGISPETSALAWLLSDAGLAVILAAEVAIMSNYSLNNIWTFKDRKINGFMPHLKKFAQFNIGSIGSIVIQYIVMQLGVNAFGIFTVLSLAGFAVTSDNFYLAAGVLIGMIWNFTVYNKIIWRSKATKKTNK